MTNSKIWIITVSYGLGILVSSQFVSMSNTTMLYGFVHITGLAIMMSIANNDE